MLLAGNGPTTPPPAPVPASTPRANSVVLDGYAIRSSPVPMTVAQSGGRSRIDTPPVKPTAIVASPSVIAAEPLKSIMPLPSVPANFFSSGQNQYFAPSQLILFKEND